ncbi:MAG: hypothetical protein ABSG76_10515 [Xanthobacteraceae bacterium]
MNRILAAAPIALVVLIAVLAVTEAATRGAALSGDSIALWAGAIAAADGEVSVGGIAAAYPTVPFLAMTLIKLITPASAPVPALLAAAVAAVLAGLWFGTARRAGWPAVTAGAATLLVIFHPAVLRAAIEGPADLLVVAFLYLLGVALYEFRARIGVPEAMAVGFALLGLAFSHPIGAAVAVGSIPLLAFATRPALVAGSALNIVLTLMFPVLFAAAAFCYVSWVFPGDGWNFLAAPSAGLAAWAAGFAHGLAGISSGSLSADAAFAIAAAIVLGAPIVPVVIVWVRQRRPLTAPPLVLAGSVVVSAALAVATRLCGSPATLAAAAPVLAMLVLTRIPVVRERRATALLLLALGWLGGAASLVIVDPRIAAQLSAASSPSSSDQMPGRRAPSGKPSAGRIDDGDAAAALALGGAVAGRDDVLVDTLNAPAVVVGRGSARGLLSPWGEPFRLAVLFSRIDAQLVAVPDPASISGAQDRLTKSFPLLFHNGLPNYRIVYQNSIWKLFERVDQVAIHQD